MIMTIPFEGGLSHYTDKLDSVCNCCYSVTYRSNTVGKCWDIESPMILGEGCRDSVECFDCVPECGERCFGCCQSVYVSMCVYLQNCTCVLCFLRE